MGAEFLHGGAKDSLLCLVGALFAFTELWSLLSLINWLVKIVSKAYADLSGTLPSEHAEQFAG